MRGLRPRPLRRRDALPHFLQGNGTLPDACFFTGLLATGHLAPWISSRIQDPLLSCSSRSLTTSGEADGSVPLCLFPSKAHQQQVATPLLLPHFNLLLDHSGTIPPSHASCYSSFPTELWLVSYLEEATPPLPLPGLTGAWTGHGACVCLCLCVCGCACVCKRKQETTIRHFNDGRLAKRCLRSSGGSVEVMICRKLFVDLVLKVSRTLMGATFAVSQLPVAHGSLLTCLWYLSWRLQTLLFMLLFH